MSAKFVVSYKLEKKANRDRPEHTIERSRIVVGSRPLADVYVPDRLVPQEAFELSFDGSRLEISVTGRLAGVFVDGRPVDGTGPIRSGSAIQVGSCLLEVTIDAAQEVCRLVVGERYLVATVAQASKKAAAPFALEESGPQEQRWGRSKVLTTANWAAAVAGVLLLASFPLAKDTEVVNRGTLARSHAIGAEGGPTGCDGCHEAFSSDYGPKCAKCHEAYDAEAHHPFARVRDFACSECHSEHKGADADIVPSLERGASGWPRTCELCHAGQDRDAKVAAAAALPDLASRIRDRPEPAVERWLQVDGFSHADHRLPRPARPSLLGAGVAPRGDVPVPCTKCHLQRESKDVQGATASAEFALVPYESCLECHADWRVDVHGRDNGGVHCFQCHARTDDLSKIKADIRTTEAAPTSGLYELLPRRHDFAKDDCRSCHVDEKSARTRLQPERLAFRHDHHVRTVTPEKGGELALAATCVPCHGDVVESASLTGLGAALPVAKLDGCETCHTEGAPKPVPAPDGAPPRRIVDMFHSVHTVEPGTSGALSALAGRESLSGGCLACHVPVAGAERMGLREGVADCSACHKGHESLGGGRCSFCHVDRRDPVNRDARGNVIHRRNEPGVFAREKAVVKMTSPVRAFDHFSPGHGADAREPSGAGCVKCHEAAAVDKAVRVADVPWPGATDRGCVECHVRERFHR